MTERDQKILAYLQKFKFLNRHQIQELVFPSQSQAQIICNRRLIKLYQNKHLNRFRPSFEEAFVYYLSNKIPQWKHCMEIADIYLILKKMLVPSWEYLELFEVEIPLGKKRVDIIFQIRFKDGNKKKIWAIELDRGTNTLNKFDKIENYTQLYMEDKWKHPIIIITVPGRIKQLQKKIKEENVMNLEFYICDIEGFKKGTWKGLSSIKELKKGAI